MRVKGEINMRVSIYTSDNSYTLQEQINKALSECKNDKVIDIKYSGKGSSAPYSSDEYSAMIIFK
ncbi:sporulation protein Cse60 [Clostridioides sp. ES-S-0145-01]|uniref:sporulation protein Cse60 n=2 Tax=Clostridioides TaxID=1870884 RepID=UPI001D11D822